MPKAKKTSLSLFRSLPGTLKESLRAKKYEYVLPSEPVLDESPEIGLLPTQPSSSTSPVIEDTTLADNTYDSIDNTYDSIDAVELVASTSTLVQSTPRSSLPAVFGLSPASLQKGRKKRKEKRQPVINEYIGHPWDCTGLVERYWHVSQVPEELVKYFWQRHTLFPQYDTLPLLLDHTGWFSITPQAIAAHIADRCTCDVIVDAFCGVGGNAIEFARTCERVIAIDNDPIRLRLARHNALHLGVADRIEFILGDYTDFARSQRMQDETVDVVFLSPPWGGPDYLQPTDPDDLVPPSYSLSSILPIHGKDLFDISDKITPNIAYFLPRNVDVYEVSQLASPFPGDTTRNQEWVEIEEEWTGPKLKAVTAYFGGLVTPHN